MCVPLFRVIGAPHRVWQRTPPAPAPACTASCIYMPSCRERETSSAAFIIIIIIILCGARPVHFYTSLNTLYRTHNEDDCWLFLYNVIVVVGTIFFLEFLLRIVPNGRVCCIGDACTKRTIEERSLFACACACVWVVSIALAHKNLFVPYIVVVRHAVLFRCKTVWKVIRPKNKFFGQTTVLPFFYFIVYFPPSTFDTSKNYIYNTRDEFHEIQILLYLSLYHYYYRFISVYIFFVQAKINQETAEK